MRRTSLISTDPGLLKIRHSHWFVAVVIQFLIPLILSRPPWPVFRIHFAQYRPLEFKK